MRGRIVLHLIIALGAIVAPAIARAATYSARLRWRSSASPGVTGYRILRHPIGSGPETVTAAGLPPQDTDGTRAFVVTGLDDQVGYGFAVQAQKSDGSLSPRSNEIELPARGATTCSCPDPGPCAQNGCNAQNLCVTTLVPDGTGCDTEDPCGGGVCIAGDCLPSGAGGDRTLAVRSFSVRRARDVAVFSGRGELFVPPGADLTGGDVTVVVSGGDGAEIWRMVLPGSLLNGRYGARMLRYRSSRRSPPPASAAGLSRFVVRLRDETASVDVFARDARLLAATDESTLRWSVELTGVCARDLALSCFPTSTRNSCR